MASVSPVNIELGTLYTDAGASASDNIDGDLIANIAAVSNVNVNAVGCYSVTYDVSDAAGNTATPVVRTVNVTPDVTAPVITLVGASSINLNLGNALIDPGSSVSDNVDPGLSATVTGSVNQGQAGLYTLAYNVTDTVGNAALPVTRSISVQDGFIAQSSKTSGGGSFAPFMLLLLLLAKLFPVRKQESAEPGGREQSKFK